MMPAMLSIPLAVLGRTAVACAALALRFDGSVGESRDVDPVAARIEAGIARAEAGDLPAALDEFVAAREAANAAGRGAAWRCATFDWARALYERALARPLPGSPPDEVAMPRSSIADARARLAAVRGDLEAARGGLIELLARAPDDLGAKAGLARIALKLRDVLARDADWRALARIQDEERNQAARGNAAAGSRPLRQGPSAAKSSAGAPGTRAGAAAEGENETPLAPGDGAAGGASDVAPLTEAEARALLDRLAEARAARRELDQRRADQAAARSSRN